MYYTIDDWNQVHKEADIIFKQLIETRRGTNEHIDLFKKNEELQRKANAIKYYFSTRRFEGIDKLINFYEPCRKEIKQSMEEIPLIHRGITKRSIDEVKIPENY